VRQNSSSSREAVMEQAFLWAGAEFLEWTEEGLEGKKRDS
jgi:hypothetical protein